MAEETLGSKLHDLWRAGNVSLPMMARRLADANLDVSYTENDISNAFTQIGDSENQVYKAWRSLRDHLQSSLAKNTENLYAAGEAVIQVMNDYKETDECAAKELETLIKEDEEWNESHEGKDQDVDMPGDVKKYFDPIYPE